MSGRSDQCSHSGCGACRYPACSCSCHDYERGPSPLADFSDARRATALSWIRGEGLLTADISYEARLLAAVGLLICDDLGHIKQADIDAAMADPSIRQAGRALLREARS